MEKSNGRPVPWALFVSELVGTALLVLVAKLHHFDSDRDRLFRRMARLTEETKW